MPITPDPGIKNVVIKKELLGKVTENNKTVLRFKIVAEDKNRKSAYSPIVFTPSAEVDAGTGDIRQLGNTLILSWATANLSTQRLYDVFIGFDSSTPTYKTTTESTNYSFLKTGTTSTRAIVQVSSINPTLSEDLEIYDSGTFGLV
jgi:hypothetical protein